MEISKNSSEVLNEQLQSKCSINSYRLLELFSGIGGMRYALEAANISYELVAAADMNPVVNNIYCHNFGSEGHNQRNINSFSVEEVDNMRVDIITMSPPCQPFTRVGLKKDIEDARSNSFLHILNILSELQRKPTFIILENVQGFENSQAKDVLVQTLQKCNYQYQEFLLSPQDFGVPNSRLRYYLVARFGSFVPMPRQISMSIPNASDHWEYHCYECLSKPNNESCLLRHFLEESSSDYLKKFSIPEVVLLKYWTVFDIVDEESTSCCCFTKAYSHYAQGTGSVFVPIKDTKKVAEIFKNVANASDSDKKLELLKSLKLRYFTPREIANIMCFPKSFNFPSHITLRQKYRSLGNSLNVFVVSCLMRWLFTDQAFS